MYLPTEEMITELTSVLEAFRDDPSTDNLDKVMEECNRITDSCEDLWCELNGDDDE